MEPLIHNRDIVMFGLQPWDIPIGSNFKNMAVEIARHNRVLYVNRPLDRISYYKNSKDPQIKARINSIRKGEETLTAVLPNIHVLNPRIIIESINFLPPGFLYDFLNKRNNKILAGEIKRVCTELKFRDVILLIDNDFLNAQYFKEYLKPSSFFYYIRDYLLSQPYFSKHGRNAEPAIIRKANGVAANSSYLAKYAAKYNNHSADIGQGCEVEEFLKAPIHLPAEIASLQGVKIGYAGALTAARLDIGLIHFIAQSKPEWKIILVGPEDEAFRSSSLHDLDNVIFTGRRTADELPGYVHAFDICINPQLLNQMTIGNYPRKVDEYLAAGKPVVATETEAMQMFRDHVFLCSAKEHYITAISEALMETSDSAKADARRSFAASHTWEASVRSLYNLISHYEN